MNTRSVIHGDVARFDVPGSWVQETEDDGRSVFYDKAVVDGGTLFVATMSASGKAVNGLETALDLMKRSIRPKQVEIVGNDYALGLDQGDGIDRGMGISHWSWIAVRPISTSALVILTLRYVIRSGRKDTVESSEEVAAMNQSARSIAFMNREA